MTTGAIIKVIVFFAGVLGFGGYISYQILKRSEDPIRLIVKGIASIILYALIIYSVSAGPFAPIFGAALGVILGIIWAPHLGALLASPITSAFDGGNQEVEARPLYSIAETKRKQGRIPEAIAEVNKQLQRFPADFTARMMLAEIQAEDQKDLLSAQETIDCLLLQPGHCPRNIAFALNRLADWHLKLEQDTASARGALERLISLVPGTDHAHLAARRLSHLQGTGEQLQERAAPRVIRVQKLEENLGLTGVDPFPKSEVTKEEVAQSYVNQLQIEPQDDETREKLALHYANAFHRLDLATEQLEELIKTPQQPQRDVVRWLNLLADVQVRLSDHVTLPYRSLKRIRDLYPNTAAAANAERRLALLKLEFQPRTASQPIKLVPHGDRLGLQDAGGQNGK